MCEEFAYSEYVKGSGRIDYAGDLAEYYLKTGQYRKAICFILEEFKTHFEDDDNWWMFIAALCPFFCFYVIDAHIALKEYHMAKGVLDALKMNREKMLEMHPDDGFTRDCEFWYACVITKYVQIALLEGDASAALDYLVNEPIFERYKNLESFFYMGILSLGNLDPEYKNISLAINCLDQISELDSTSDNYIDEEKDMIVASNYYLGKIYAEESGYKNKEKAEAYLNKAKNLGYSISDEEIRNLTESISNEPEKNTSSNQKSSGGCYVATCVYGSYDCPEVWTLRRFRDNTLSKNIFGRMFIKVYYATSPTVVELFGRYKWFHKIWKAPLDKIVRKLQNDGVKNTPYID